MNQTRLHLTTARQTAEMIYAELERAFEDDGFPVAILEVDEARDLHEVSLYVPAEELADAEARMHNIASRFEPKLSVEAEEVPDI